MKATLTDGRVIELQDSDFNVFGQVNIHKLIERGIASDVEELCELLGAVPCDVHYGAVHPGIEIEEEDIISSDREEHNREEDISMPQEENQEDQDVKI